jgi:hypothetical protein
MLTVLALSEQFTPRGQAAALVHRPPETPVP